MFLKNIFLKYNSLSVQVKAAMWFVFCSVMQKGIKFITVPIFTRIMTADEYGEYSLYLSWLEILTIITSLYLYHGVLNNGLTKFDTDRVAYISSMQGLTITINVVVFIIYLLFSKVLNRLIGLPTIMIYFMFLEMLVTPALAFWSGKQRFEFKYKRLVVITLLKCMLDPIIGLVAVMYSDNKSLARIISIVVVEVAICGSIMLLQFYKGKKFFVSKYWKYGMRLALPLLPHYLSGTVLNQGNRILIDKLVGTAEVAYYSVAYSIGMVAQLFTSAINNSFIPWMYQKIKANEITDIRKTINGLMFFVTGCTVFLMLFSPELVLVFGSDVYREAVGVIPPIAASVFFIFLYNMVAIPQFYYEKTKFLLVSSLVAALMNILLGYFFIGQFGYLAAGYTTLLCYIFYSMGHYFISCRITRKYLPGINFYDIKVILYCSIIVVLAAIFCNFIFEKILVRYIISVTLIFIAILKRKSIVSILMKNK